jgi:hypothetical protein
MRVRSQTREQFEPWLETYLRRRFPELERPLVEAISAFDEIVSGKPVDTERLQRLVDAASSDRVPLYENGTELLGRLAQTHDAARQAVKKMAADSKAQTRFNAILCVSDSAPRDFALAVVRNGLLDDSARVREKAADWALRCHLSELVPQLRAALKKESNINAISCIELALQQLRRGRAV